MNDRDVEENNNHQNNCTELELANGVLTWRWCRSPRRRRNVGRTTNGSRSARKMPREDELRRQVSDDVAQGPIVGAGGDQPIWSERGECPEGGHSEHRSWVYALSG